MRKLITTENRQRGNNPISKFGTLNLYNLTNQLPAPLRQKNIKTGGLMYDDKLQIRNGNFSNKLK